jgi:hypothetical protein
MTTILRTLSAAALLGVFAAAHASLVVPKYDIINDFDQPIDHIMMFWRAPESGYGTGSLVQTSDPGFEAAGNHAPTHLQDLGKPAAPTGLLMLGIYTDSAISETPGQEHAVLFMDSATATKVNHIAWGTVYRNTLEEDLLGWIHTVSDPDADSEAQNAAYDGIFGFVDGDADHIPDIASPTGTISSWLTPMPTGQATAGKIMMFSDGTQIGTFTATNTVPEPGTLAAFGFGAATLLRRRRKA